MSISEQMPQTEAEDARPPKITGGSIGKAIVVLKSFIDGQEAWGVRELASSLDLPTTSVHRMLTSMRGHGIVVWEEATGKYRLGPEMHRWAAVMRFQHKLPAIVQPVARELVARFGESCWFAVYDRTSRQLWYGLEVASKHPLRFQAPIGKQEQLFESPAGVAMLAQLPKDQRMQTIAEAAAAGYGVAQAELDAALANGYVLRMPLSSDRPVILAAPVIDAKKQPVGSLLIVMPEHRFDPALAAEMGNSLARAAQALSHAFGARFLTGSEAAGSHPAMRAIAAAVRQRIESLQLVPWERGGSSKLIEVQEGFSAYGTAVGTSLEAAYLGRAPFTQAHDRLRTVAAIGPLHLHILASPEVTANNPHDMRALRVSPGERDYATADVYEHLMSLYNVRAADVDRCGGEVRYLDYRESNRLFEQGRLDALVSFNITPTAAYRRLAETRDFRLVGLDRTAMDVMTAWNSVLRVGTIPGGTYACEPNDIHTLEAPLVIVTNAERDENEVFDFLRAIHESQEQLTKVLPALTLKDTPEILSRIPVPVHPGARRYFRKLT